MPITRRKFLGGLGSIFLASLAGISLSDLLEPSHTLENTNLRRDFMILYSPGGLGRSPLKTDPEFVTIVNGVKVELENLGYSVMATEHIRCSSYNIPFAIDQLLSYYHKTARELSAQLDYITRHNGVRIILMGECFGASFNNRVMEFLETNGRVYSIQLGLPFYVRPVRYRTLVVNGIEGPDPISTGDPIGILGLFVSKIRGLPQTNHFYAWDHPDIQRQVRSFLYSEVLN